MLVDLVQTTTRDGVRLDGIFQAPSSSDGSGVGVDGLCLVHGTGGNFYSSTLFQGLADRLVQLGCAILRVNTRGHDLMSTAATPHGGRRQGAAYEVVDDCRQDVAAWLEYLRQRVGPRVGLLGHSLGAVKCLYALANEPLLATCVIAVSPPRLSYSWYNSSPEGPQFRETYALAERHLEAGQPQTVLEVRLPLPFVVTAGGYVEKYGPDERYNYLRFLSRVCCPMLVTLGGVEVENNMAFRGTPEELSAQAAQVRGLRVTTVAEADHFYTKTRDALITAVVNWLRELPP
jgi:pimeloyl-ACP methyl ester carboxylesterase